MQAGRDVDVVVAEHVVHHPQRQYLPLRIQGAGRGRGQRAAWERQKTGSDPRAAGGGGRGAVHVLAFLRYCAAELHLEALVRRAQHHVALVPARAHAPPHGPQTGLSVVVVVVGGERSGEGRI